MRKSEQYSIKTCQFVSQSKKGCYALTSNSKLKKDGIISFDLPCIKTCPFAAQCKKGCYASRCSKVFKCALAKQERNLVATKRKSFIPDLVGQIAQCKEKIIRFHASGDFYSRRYIDKCFAVCRALPEKQFYCYTKSVAWFKDYDAQGQIPDNFKVIYSYGGKQDHLIEDHDAHCHVVDSVDQLNRCVALGYVYGNESDLVAVRHKKIVLLYHGVQKKLDKNKFSTWNGI